MRRFLFAFSAGALLLAGGQTALSLGLHPGHPAAPRLLLQGGAGLVLGAAVVVSALLGLAEGCEEATAQLRRLLPTKAIDAELEVEAKTPSELRRQERRFWRAYWCAALALCLFMAGLLGLALLLAGRPFYRIGLGAGAAFFGLTTLLLSFRGLLHMRRTHCALKRAASTLAAQPDRPAKTPPSRLPRRRWAVFEALPPSALEERRRTAAS